VSDAELIDGGRMQPMPLPESDWDRDLAAARAAAIAERDAAWVQAVRDQMAGLERRKDGQLYAHECASFVTLHILLRAMGEEA